METCDGTHRFFFADIVAVEEEGTVYVISICTACGKTQVERIEVAKKGSALRLLSEEKQKEK